MGDNDVGKKRSRSYYKKCMYKKRKRWNSMDVGMQGFLVTCNNNESQAVKEMYNLFNEYAEKLYGPEQFHGLKKETTEDNEGKLENTADDDDDDDNDDEEEDIEEALKKEVNALKQTVPAERRFQQLNTGAKNCLFIKTTLSNPCELIHAILKDIYETQVQKSRFALRVIPIQTICRANLTDINSSAQDLFEPFFRTAYGTMLTYGISFKARMTSKVSRDEVIDKLCQIIGEMNPLNKVNYSNPDLIVLVEVLRGFCCLSVVKDFNKFRKYNLQETARAQQAETRTAANSSSSKTDPVDNKSSTPTTNSTSEAVVDTTSTDKEETAATTAAEPTSTVAVDTATEPTSTVAVDTAAEPTSTVAVDTAAEPTSTIAVDTAVEPTSTVAVDTAAAKETASSV